MSMTPIYGPGKPEEEMMELIHQAVKSGITFLDTAKKFGGNANECLVGKVHECTIHDRRKFSCLSDVELPMDCMIVWKSEENP